MLQKIMHFYLRKLDRGEKYANSFTFAPSSKRASISGSSLDDCIKPILNNNKYTVLRWKDL